MGSSDLPCAQSIERGFADQADLELFAESPGVGVGAEATHPVVAASAKIDCPITGVVVNPDVSGNSTLNGMAHVVLVVAISVGPSVHRLQGLEVSPDHAEL
jgi:hypothetical protein